MSMIRTLFHDERQRGQAIGIWTGVMTAGVGLGPVLSGVLLAHFWWGSVFLVNLPAMALLLVVGPLLLPRGERRRGAPFDVLGSVLSLAAMLPDHLRHQGVGRARHRAPLGRLHRRRRWSSAWCSCAASCATRTR